MLQRLLLVLIFSLFVLLVALAVVVGGYALTLTVQDTTGATVLWWIAMGCLMMVVVDILVLVGVLGVWALIELQQPPNEPPDRSQS